MAATDKLIVLTNCASAKEAQRIARALVERAQAACVNMPAAPVQSIYRWKGKIETAKEFPLLIKTTRAAYAAVEQTIREFHSYEVPEIIAIPISKGSPDYLSWIAGSVKARRKGGRLGK
jgi:periplasmic divalent cation tolerance protein